MKYLRLFLLTAVLAGAGLGLSSWLTPSAAELTIGDALPMMAEPMADVMSGENKTLRELQQKNGLLVVFSCNTCPFVIQWEDRYNDLYDLCQKNEIGMVLINSNEAKRAGDDSADKMASKGKAEGYKMPYLVDTRHKLADAMGARTTPHIYLFDESAKLAYRGAIDDNGADASAVESPFLANAIKMMSEGKSPDPETTKAVGCSIKRVKH